MITQHQRNRLLSPLKRLMLGGFLLLLVGLFLIGVGTLPFLYPSTSLWYLFGADKTYLQTAKVVGLVTGALALMQIFYATRWRVFAVILKRRHLFALHTWLARLIVVGAVLHPVVMFVRKDLSAVQFAWKFWPEYVGGVLLFLVISLFSTGQWRGRLKIAAPSWLRLHRALAFLVVVLLGVHLFNVSDTFQKGSMPRLYGMVTFGLFFLVWLSVRVRLYRRSNKKKE